MSTPDQKKLRKQQKEWLDDIERRTGDNLAQMTEACNLIAKKNKVKELGKDTLRHFYHYDSHNRPGDRVLSDRAVFLLYKAYELEPPFESDLLYDIDKDKSELGLYAKLCKQYVTDVSLAKGIYRVDIGRDAGLNATTIGRLFSDKLPKGLQMKSLEAIRDRYGVNFSPRFRAFLAQKGGAEGVTVIGALYLNTDQVLLYAEADQRLVEAPPGIDAKLGRAIEMKGPMHNPLVKEGMMLFYNETKQGVADECIDATCLVAYGDGRLGIRFVARGHKRGEYRLHSLVNAAIEDTALKAASKIELIIQK